MRSDIEPPESIARCQAVMKVRACPACRSPVGVGAMRPRYPLTRSAIADGPARVAHYVLHGRDRVFISVRGQHAPADIFAIRQRQEWEASNPPAAPKSPCHS